MRITYYVPVTEGSREAVYAVIRQIFQVEPHLVNRTTDIAQLVHSSGSQVVPYLVFDLDRPGTFTPLQRAFISGPGVEVKRQYSPGEILYESIQDKTYA